jgi:TfoX/Sxy family transcriptional regulator of competence genes
MATSKTTMAHVLEQLEPLNVRSRAMFGEYALYCDEKVVAFVCDDTVFLKPSSASARLGIHLVPAPPYPGAKDYFVIGEAIIEDDEEFREVVRRTAEALPVPKPKARPASGRARP